MAIHLSGSLCITGSITVGVNQTNNGNCAVVIGGANNSTSGMCSAIIGGDGNTSTGFRSLTAGHENLNSGNYTTVLGQNNTASLAHNAFIVGTQNDILDGNNSNIVGSYLSNINVSGTTSTYSILLGGSVNCIIGSKGQFNAVLGACNTINNAHSASILGGLCNTITHDGSHIIGSNLTSDKACYTFMNNLDVAGTVSASIFSGSFVGDGSGLTGISGGVDTSGTPADNQVAVFTDSDTIEGDSNFVWNSSLGILGVSGTLTVNLGTNERINFTSGTTTNNGALTSVLGGCNHIIETLVTGSTIAGGRGNKLTKNCSFIGGGSNNTGSTAFSAIVGGGSNSISGSVAQNYSFIGGGSGNQIGAGCATIAGGTLNCNFGLYATLGGGAGNVNNCQGATIAGGYYNELFGLYATVGGGYFNSASGDYSTIAGGSRNTGSGDYSGILGGRNNYISHNCSFAIGSNLTSTAVCTTFVNNLNVETSASAQHFSGSFVGDGSGLTGISAGGVTIANDADNRVITAVGNGTLNAEQYFQFDTGKRGVCIGTSQTQTGNLESSILGGRSNTIGVCANCATIGGGTNNEITANSCRSGISAGSYNIITAKHSVIAGGCQNTGSAPFSVIGGGCQNYVTASNAVGCTFIGSGACNELFNAGASAIVAGVLNKIESVGNNAASCNFIGGGSGNIISGSSILTFSSIVGGYQNSISGSTKSRNFIGGGTNNSIRNTSCAGILGGSNNKVSHSDSFAIGSNITSTAINTTFVNNLTVSGSGTTVVVFKNLPTSDPTNAGQLWNDSGTLKVSAG